MAQLEHLASKESLLENETNAALQAFSLEMKKLQNEVLSSKKDLKARTKEEMKTYLESGELRKRMDGYVKINGEKIEISKIELDETNSLLKMKYKVKFGDVPKEINSFFLIMGEENNTYLQFKKNPAAKADVTSIELYDKEWTKTMGAEEWYRGGIMYDINIVKNPNKGIDIRIVANERKTKEKILEKIKKYELAPEFTPEDFKDETLENTKIETLQYTKLGKEVISNETETYRAIFMKEWEKYREIGKVYFNAKGEVDTNKTKTVQNFQLLGVTMTIAIDTSKNTFALQNIDELKNQIKKQREVLTSYIWNSEFGDNTIFTGFNRPKGTDRKQTKLLGLKLIDDNYSFKRGTTEDKINFWFNEKNELIMKDIANKEQEPITIEIIKGNGKKELKEITKNAWKNKLIINPASHELVTNQEKPKFENAPPLFKDNIYNQNGGNIEYHTSKWELVSSIPATKTEKNEWKLGELNEDVKTEELFKDIKRTTIDKTMTEILANSNLLENDLYTAFDALRANSKVQLKASKVVKVLDDEKNGIYKYYNVNQYGDWSEFVFTDDIELYDEAKKIMNEVLTNVKIIEKIENIQLVYKDKKEKIEKSLTKFVWGNGLLPIDTEAKIKFLQETKKNKGTLTRVFIRWNKTDDIQRNDIVFGINNQTVTTEAKTQMINIQKYKTRLEEKNGTLKLRFDDIK